MPLSHVDEGTVTLWLKLTVADESSISELICEAKREARCSANFHTAADESQSAKEAPSRFLEE